MIRHCCWVFCRYLARTDGRTPCEVLRNASYRGGLACFGEIVWARVPGSRLLRGKDEVNWLELVWLGKTENTEEHLCGDEHGVRKFRTIRRQPESARWRREYVDKLSGDPFNYVTEALVNEHGRTMGCPRCTSGIGIHNEGSKESCCNRAV